MSWLHFLTSSIHGRLVRAGLLKLFVWFKCGSTPLLMLRHVDRVELQLVRPLTTAGIQEQYKPDLGKANHRSVLHKAQLTLCLHAAQVVRTEALCGTSTSGKGATEMGEIREEDVIVDSNTRISGVRTLRVAMIARKPQSTPYPVSQSVTS